MYLQISYTLLMDFYSLLVLNDTHLVSLFNTQERWTSTPQKQCPVLSL